MDKKMSRCLCCKVYIEELNIFPLQKEQVKEDFCIYYKKYFCVFFYAVEFF